MLQRDPVVWRSWRARARGAGCVGLALWALLAALAGRARAENDDDLLILRTGVPGAGAALARRVDAELSRTLAALGYRARVSPVPFEDLELAAGCQGSTTECLRAMRGAFQSEWVLVRSLTLNDDDAYELALFAQDGAKASQTRRALAQLSMSDLAGVARAVPDLVGLLLPPRTAAQVAASASPSSARRSDQQGDRVLPAVGWSSLSAGAVLVAVGVGLGVAANRDSDQHEGTVVRTAEDAEQAQDLHDRAERRARAANGLWISGVTVGASGAALLIWNAVRSRRTEPRVRAAISLTPSSGVLTVAGTLGRRR